MPYMTGELRTIGLGNLVGLSPVVEFQPSDNAVGTISAFYANKPETAIPDVNGEFTVRLRETTTVRFPADFHYKIRIKYLDPTFYGDSGMGVVEFPDWKIYVPEGGGNLVDHIADTSAPWNQFILWTGVTAPLAYTSNTWWFNPADNWLKKWSV